MNAIHYLFQMLVTTRQKVVANGCNRVIGFNAIWSETGCGFKPNSYSYTGLGYGLVCIILYMGVKRSNVLPKLHFYFTFRGVALVANGCELPTPYARTK